MRPQLALSVAALALSACTAVKPGPEPLELITGPVPTRSASPMTEALACLKDHLRPELDLRIAVQSIPDKSGVLDYDGPGAYFTQGAELMMITALSKAGVRQVNRTATSISEWELNHAMQKRLGDGHPTKVNGATMPFRPVAAGGLLGSTHTLYGGLTELDFDIVSDGAEVEVAGVGVKARGYYVSIGMDIVVADTRSTEIVTARSYRKAVWGREIGGSLFRFWDIGNGGSGVGDLGIELFDIRVGKQENEPMHASVRWVVEQAAYEITRDLSGLGGVCDYLVPGPSVNPPETLLADARGETVEILAGPAGTDAFIGMPDKPAPLAASDDQQSATEKAASDDAAALAAQEPPAAQAMRLPDGRVLPPRQEP